MVLEWSAMAEVSSTAGSCGYVGAAPRPSRTEEIPRGRGPGAVALAAADPGAASSSPAERRGLSVGVKVDLGTI